MHIPESWPRIRPFILMCSLVIIFILAWGMWLNHDQLFQPTDMQAVGRAYSQSQYILGDLSPAKIDDSTLYVYAGQAYLQGEDPTTINFEQPPLVKYIFGLSQFLFKSSFTLNLLILAAVLVAYITLSKKIGLSDWLTLVSLVIMVVSTPLLTHLGYALLDSFLLLMTLLFFIALFSIKKFSINMGVLIGVILGVIAATKYPIPLMLLYLGVLGLWLLLKHQVRLLLIIMPTMILVYLATYLMYFVHGHTLLDFLRFEIYRFHWWTDDRSIPRYLIFQTLFFGHFPEWWDSQSTKVVIDHDWRLWWPILFIIQFLGQIIAIWKRQYQFILLGVYVSGLTVMYALGSATFGRYLMQTIPFWILIIAGSFQYWNLRHASKKTS